MSRWKRFMALHKLLRIDAPTGSDFFPLRWFSNEGSSRQTRTTASSWSRILSCRMNAAAMKTDTFQTFFRRKNLWVSLFNVAWRNSHCEICENISHNSLAQLSFESEFNCRCEGSRETWSSGISFNSHLTITEKVAEPSLLSWVLWETFFQCKHSCDEKKSRRAHRLPREPNRAELLFLTPKSKVVSIDPKLKIEKASEIFTSIHLTFRPAIDDAHPVFPLQTMHLFILHMRSRRRRRLWLAINSSRTGKWRGGISMIHAGAETASEAFWKSRNISA